MRSMVQKLKKKLRERDVTFLRFCSDSSGGTEEDSINIYFNFTVTNKCNSNQ